jgi:uncharacterized RDD family membrane protein YckC
MESINILTSQNVEIKMSVANLGERILAGIIDMAVMFFYIVFFAFVASGHWSNFYILLIVPMMFYHLLCEVFLNGQSFGKKLMKIRVVKVNGTHVSLGSYLLRWMFRLIENPFLMYDAVAIITIAINGKGQRLGDIAANTTVISLKRKINLSETMLKELPEEWVVTFPEVSKLTDSDINTVNEVLRSYNAGRTQELWDIVIKAREVTERKMAVNVNLDSLEFLKKVIGDYNYMNRS